MSETPFTILDPVIPYQDSFYAFTDKDDLKKLTSQGQVVWTAPYVRDHIRSIQVLFNQLVLVTQKGALINLDAFYGFKLWHQKSFDIQTIQISLPNIIFQNKSGQVGALDMKTGQLLWQTKTKFKDYLVVRELNQVLGLTLANTLLHLDLSSGEVLGKALLKKARRLRNFWAPYLVYETQKDWVIYHLQLKKRVHRYPLHEGKLWFQNELIIHWDQRNSQISRYGYNASEPKWTTTLQDSPKRVLLSDGAALVWSGNEQAIRLLLETGTPEPWRLSSPSLPRYYRRGQEGETIVFAKKFVHYSLSE